jgi:hypothetical protein
MKFVLQKRPVKYILYTIILCIAILSVNTLQAQTCPQPAYTSCKPPMAPVSGMGNW